MGIDFFASPPLADARVLSGPLASHRNQALERDWERLPEPKVDLLGISG